MNRPRSFAALSLVAFAVACSSTPTPASDAAPDAPDAVIADAPVTADAPVAPDAPTRAQQVVVRESGTSDVIAGALVAWDRPDGTRALSTTDDQGVVTLRGVGDGPLGAVTAWKHGYAAHSVVGLTARADALSVELMWVRADAVTLHGTLRNTLPDARNASVRVPQLASNFAGTSFDLAVRRGRATPLLVLEIGAGVSTDTQFENTLLRWSELDLPAFDADQSRDIDLGASAHPTPTRYRVTASLPEGYVDPRLDNPWLLTEVYADNEWVSQNVSSSASGDRRSVVAVGECVHPERAAFTRYVLRLDGALNTSRIAMVIEAGAPAAEHTVQGFVAVPEMDLAGAVTPTFRDAVGLSPATGLFARELIVSRGGRPSWQVTAPGDATRIEFPALPDAARTDSDFGAAPYTVALRDCAAPAGATRCDRLSTSSPVAMAGTP